MARSMVRDGEDREPSDGIGATQAIQASIENVGYMDARIGRFLDDRDRLEISDNAVVVDCGDPRRDIEEQGLWRK